MEDTASSLTIQPAVRKRSRAIRRRNRRRASRCSSRRRQGVGTDTPDAIPTFSTSNRVTANAGRIDALKVGLLFPYQSFDDPEETKLFWKHLGGPKREFKGNEEATLYSPFFGAAGYNGDKSMPLKFRQKASYYNDSSKMLNAPLVGGSVYGSRGSGRRDNGEMAAWCRIKDQKAISINPTRAINHRGKELLDGEGWQKTSFRNDTGSFIRGLDGKSNICPRSLSQSEYREASRKFLLNLFTGLGEDLRRAWLTGNGFCYFDETGDLIEGQGIPFESLSAQKVETYWEFLDDNATALLGRLEPLLRSYWKASKTTDHGFQSAMESNAKSILIHKDGGTSIRIYAKEIDRLRIEVIHSPQGSKNLIPRYSANSLEGFLEITDTLAEKAAAEVNALLSFIEDGFTETPEERANSTEYLSRWFSQMGNGRRSLDLLNLLRSSGRVVSGNALSAPLKAELKKAEAAGLVSGQSTIYRPKRELTSEDESVTSVSHESDTQHADAGFVTRSESTHLNSRRRVPPSPFSPFAKRNPDH